MDTNLIVNVLCAVLKEKFPDVEIYVKEVAQGLKLPCFFVWEINASHEQALGNRYKQNHKFVIRYIEDDTHNCVKLRSVLYMLLEILDFVEYKDVTFRCSNINYKIEDGVLYFFFDVNMEVLKVVPGIIKMNDLEVIEYGKERGK